MIFRGGLRWRRVLLLAALMAVALAPSASAAGRAPYGGRLRVPVTPSFGLAVADPHQARSNSQRLAARLTHCRLFDTDGAGRLRGELAERWTFRGRSMLVTLARGARFHNGVAVSASDVVASLGRVKELGAASPISALVGALKVSAAPGGKVLIEFGRGVKRRTLSTLLARSELGILHRGSPGPGHGCGAFQVVSLNGNGAELVAFTGHPGGRPWIDTLSFVVAGSPSAQVERFVFKRTDVSFESSHRYPGGTAELHVNRFSTVFAQPHPRWSQGRSSGTRAAIHQALTRQSLARFLPWQTTPARAPWPDPIAPTSRRLTTVSRASSKLVGPLTVAYPAGEVALKDLARVVRDRLRPLVDGGVRIMGVPGLSSASVASAGDTALAASATPTWHLALTIHDWGATDPAQAAWEASTLLGIGGLRPLSALAGQSRRWADRVIAAYRLMPLVHIKRPVFHRGVFRLVPSNGAVRYEESYRRP